MIFIGFFIAFLIACWLNPKHAFEVVVPTLLSIYVVWKIVEYLG